MAQGVNKLGRTGGRRLRAVLLLLKMVGLVAALGGLASLSALGRFGPVPETQAGWALLRDVSRAVFMPCVLGGLLLTIAAGVALWLRAPKAFLRTRWFRVKVVVLAVSLPSLHLWARGRVTALYDAIDRGDLADLEARWDGATRAYAVALVFLLAAAIFARAKPRLGGP